MAFGCQQAAPPAIAAPAPVATTRDAGTPDATQVVTAPPDAAPDPSPSAELDLRAWLAARGVTEPGEEIYGCTELVVGTAREPAVLCTLIEEVSRPIRDADMPAFRVVTHDVIRVVRGRKLVTVLDAVIRFQPLDGPPPRPDAPPIVDPIAVAHDGRSVTVGSPDDAAGCKLVATRATRALAGLGADDRVGRAWIVLDRDLETSVCAARGRYVWRGGRFVR